MPAHLVAIALIWGATGLAFVMAPGLDLASRIRAGVAWAGTAAIFFLVRDFSTVLFLTFLLFLLITPAMPVARLAFYVVAIPTVPVYVTAQIGFPGLNYLIELTPTKIAVIAILIPLFFLPRSPRDVTPPISVSEICLLCYAVLTGGVIAYVATSTTGLRFFIDQVLTLALPYIAFRRYIRNQIDLDACLKAFVIVSLILAAVTLAATSRQWDFYRFYEPPSVFSIPDRRTGFIRIAATANGHSLGYHLAAALLVLEYLKLRLGIRFVHLMLLRLILVGGIVFTDSRGAMLGVAAGWMLMHAMRSQYMVVWAIVGSVGAAAGGVWLLFADMSGLDPHGTFAYRQDLFLTSVQHILSNFVFGDYLFRSSGKFDHLIHGQGIVDVTNLYIQIALYYGVPALILYLAVPFAAIFSTFKSAPRQAVETPRQIVSSGCIGFRRLLADRDAAHTEQPDPSVSAATQLVAARTALAGAVAGWLILVATTSDVGLTLHVGLLLSAMCSAASRLQPQSFTISRAQSTDRMALPSFGLPSRRPGFSRRPPATR